jgi:hypothetical protein
MLEDPGERRDFVNHILAVFMFVDLGVVVLVRPEARAVRIGIFLLGLFVAVMSGYFAHRYLRVPRTIHDVRKFGLDENLRIWRRARQSYSYLGVSGGTIATYFRLYVDRYKFPAGCEVRFLLAKPGSECLRESKRNELGREPSADEISALSFKIEEQANFYHELKAAGLGVEVRFYPGYHGYWAHFVNCNEVIVGPFLKGQDGLETTIMHLKCRGKSNVLLQFYKEEFERLWESPDTISFKQYLENKKKAAGVGA